MSSSTNFMDDVIPTKKNTGLRHSERRLLLSSVDWGLTAIAFLLSIIVSPVARFSGVPQLSNYAIWIAILFGIWLVVIQLLDTHRLDVAAQPFRSMWSGAGAAVLTAILFNVIPVLTPGSSRLLHFLYFPFFAFVLIGVWRMIYANWLYQPSFARRVLVIGAGDTGRAFLSSLPRLGDKSADFSSYGYKVLGFVDDAENKQGKTIAGVPVIGKGTDLSNIVNEMQPDEIVIAISNTHRMEKPLLDKILEAREQGIHITTMLDAYEMINGRVPVAYAGSNVHVASPMERPASHRLYLGVQRLVDLIIGVIGCGILFFVLPFVWITNRLTDPGDLFYKQERVGLNGRNFDVIKFRSMVMDAEKFSGAVWATENDPRITPMGRFLRKTRLDELPQFWNVLKGEMSIVGPRPERPHFVEQLAEEIPFYRARHAVKPGITGWAQVNYGYGATLHDSLMKLEYDLYYIKHQNLYLDLLTINKTFQVMVGMRGR